MNYIEGTDRHQQNLLSSIDDWITEDNPVRVIDSVIDSIVMSNKERFEKVRESEVGRPGYHDTTLLKLYCYGYFNSISSSRRLEVECYRNKELIWLIEGLAPDHWTISNYRKENGEEIKFVTKKFREFLRAKGYIRLQTVAIDGSKVKANTNREMLTIEKIESRLEGLDKKMESYLMKLSETDKIDEVKDELGIEESEESGKKYIEKIIELQKQVESLHEQKAILEKENRKYISNADREAPLMKSRDGKIPAYNVQIAVDSAHYMIADDEVVLDQSDNKMAPYMIGSLKEEYGDVPDEALVDNGYNKLDLIEEIEKKEPGLKLYVPQQKTKEEKGAISFEYDADKDEYKCSEGKRLVLFQRNKIHRGSQSNVYRGIECEGCPIRSQCTKAPKGRILHRYVNQTWRDEYKKKMSSKESTEKMKKRRSLVEHVFGTMKYWMGKIPLKLRGRDKVSTEIRLYATAYNLKRLINIDPVDEILSKIMNYDWRTA